MSFVGVTSGSPEAGREHVVDAKHGLLRLHHRFSGEGHVNCHLVAVKVCVEGGAYQRVELDGAALYQHGHKGPGCLVGAA